MDEKALYKDIGELKHELGEHTGLLRRILNQTERHNNRLTKVEERQRTDEELIRKMAVEYSELNGIVRTMEMNRQDRLSKKIEELEKGKKSFREARIWFMFVIILFILGYIGIINSEFINFIKP